ncbi:hypothetical protein K32_39050 [Kaistia sp. 32K]|uniref:hypothetical protein n=1 Tax=Kaistia sp. 32K TaxID=2795690 RepID=UPI001915DDC0|nr:hypothetical protein [Kaistia sp. 32K]BCP55288.1 hypothetical protein K32_39050 [Kaistia sp. 32K]
MSMKMLMLAAASMALALPLAPTEALAVSKSHAQTTCINAAATSNNALRGNIHIRRAKPHGSGYEFGLVVDGRELNCIVAKNGKIQYLQ